MFDSRKYWKDRHKTLKGDLRAVGCANSNHEELKSNFKKAENNILPYLSNLKSGSKILDFGCGVGRLAPMITNLGYLYHGIDISKTAIVAAWKLDIPTASFEVSDMVSYSGTGYDLAICYSVLLHITSDTEWKQALSTLVNCTEPGGSVLIIDTIPVEPYGETASHVKIRTHDQYLGAVSELGLQFKNLGKETVFNHDICKVWR